MNKTLVLDVGGVLATNLTPGIWQQLAQHGGIEQAELYLSYKQELSSKLWQGHITILQWWDWLVNKGISLNEAQQQQLIQTHLQPLAALNMLQEWSTQCHIIIMSNHRSEWLIPLLEPVRTFLSAVCISDQVKLSKPNVDWFQKIDKDIQLEWGVQHVLFVDDSSKNLQAAAQVNWHTMLADEQGLWTKQIKQWLQH